METTYGFFPATDGFVSTLTKGKSLRKINHWMYTIIILIVGSKLRFVFFLGTNLFLLIITECLQQIRRSVNFELKPHRFGFLLSDLKWDNRTVHITLPQLPLNYRVQYIQIYQKSNFYIQKQTVITRFINHLFISNRDFFRIFRFYLGTL